MDAQDEHGCFRAPSGRGSIPSSEGRGQGQLPSRSRVEVDLGRRLKAGDSDYRVTSVASMKPVRLWE